VNIQVVVAEPGKPPEIRTMEYGLVPLRKLLDGDVALVTTARNSAVFQGKGAKKRKRMFNRVISGRHRTYGTILIARLSESAAADIGSLSDEEAKAWVSVLG
jgi:hypothetical protein